MKTTRPGRESGSAMAAMMVSVLVCGALSAAVLLTNTGRSREAQKELFAERAFQLAEGGADWGVSKLRIANGVVPASNYVATVSGVGSAVVRFTAGTANGLDEDGDGTADDADESSYASIVSTGTSGGVSRSVQIVMRRAIVFPRFEAAVQLNVEAPVVDLKGNAFEISGENHFIDGTVDASTPEHHGIASPAPVTYVVSQIASSRYSQITGLGADPSVGQVEAIDLDFLVEQASAAASMIIDPGTHSGLSLGTPVPGGTIISYCSGDLHLSGSAAGAGVLVVDGDLRISGGLEWVGIILVRGHVTMVGGGGAKRVIGALVVGEEAETDTSTTEVTVTGTVDLYFSADAITLASESFATMTVLTWREVANP